MEKRKRNWIEEAEREEKRKRNETNRGNGQTEARKEKGRKIHRRHCRLRNGGRAEKEKPVRSDGRWLVAEDEGMRIEMERRIGREGKKRYNKRDCLPKSLPHLFTIIFIEN